MWIQKSVVGLYSFVWLSVLGDSFWSLSLKNNGRFKRVLFLGTGGPRPASMFSKYFEMPLLVIILLTPVKCHLDYEDYYSRFTSECQRNIKEM